ncbi:MAG TPA: transketolase [Gemmatimonadaceae bacterium]|nr:transketolase [Gemmatimonadaceae bacterium]
MPRGVSTTVSIEELSINTIRTLAMDAVQRAESGHPGTPMALAPLGYTLFMRHLRHDPSDPTWIDRDRFVLSAGHASMLLYSLLYLTGYDLDLEDLKQFRQWGSRTPGHPEYGFTPGIETTTGPLGQGVGNAVGMAVAEAHLAALFNREGHRLLDHWTYFIASDGDIMEGLSHEAASFAGHMKLHKLIGFYDDNKITIDGRTDLTFSDDTAMRFEGYGWHVQRVLDVNDLDALDKAIVAAKAETQRPSLIIVRSIIGYGSPNRSDTAKAHGEPLGEEEVRLTKEALGWPSQEPFHVPEEALAHWRSARERGAELRAEWERRRAAYEAAYPEPWRELERRLDGRLPERWDADLPSFTSETGSIASRAASGKVLAALAKNIPELIGGSADLTGSNNTLIPGAGVFSADSYASRYIHFGIREHGMGSIMNGMSLHGGVIPYGGTFLIFSDYMRPPIRLAALMHQRVIHIFTHDSIGLGEDGPTHQPIEQLTALRCIPNITVLRPADACETREAWKVALSHRGGPVSLVLTRQKLSFIDRQRFAPADGVARGGYVLAEASGGSPRIVLMSSGSEVNLILTAMERLEKHGIPTRVVSMASLELFARQPESYRDEVLPPGVCRLAIEAAHPMSWYRWIGPRGVVMGLERFGASAPYQRIYEELGLTVERIVREATELVGGTA